MIKKFRDMMKDDKEFIDIDLLMNDLDRADYDKWLGIFKSITPFTVAEGLDTIIDEFHLTRKDSVVLLAYIKFFEQRIFEMSKEKEVKKSR